MIHECLLISGLRVGGEERELVRFLNTGISATKMDSVKLLHLAGDLQFL